MEENFENNGYYISKEQMQLLVNNIETMEYMIGFFKQNINQILESGKTR